MPQGQVKSRQQNLKPQGPPSDSKPPYAGSMGVDRSTGSKDVGNLRQFQPPQSEMRG